MPSAATSVSNTASVKGEFGFCACFYFIVNKEKYFFFSMSFFFYIGLVGILELTYCFS